MLPQVNGRKLAENARQLRPGLQLLFISGYAEAWVRGEFLDAGMDMLSNPFSLDALAAKVSAKTSAMRFSGYP